MAKQVLDIGVTTNDGTGDTLRQAGQKLNDMFSEVYTTFGDGTNLTTASGIPSVSADPTPQLGGTLDLNSNFIGGTGSINIVGTIGATGNITSASGTVDAAYLQIDNDANIDGNLVVDGSGTISSLSVLDTFQAGSLTTPGNVQAIGDGIFGGKLITNGASSTIRFYHASTSTFLNPVTYKGAIGYADDVNKVYFAGDSGWQTLAREDSPSFTGTPIAPTPATSDDSTKVATTEYVKRNRDQIQAAIDLKANIASPTFTGVPSTPTQLDISARTTQIANASFVRSVADELYNAIALKANIASPTFTGTPLTPTPATAARNTQIATTAYVKNNLDNYATLASPSLTGTPTAPTASAGTSTTQIATTNFVNTAVGNAVTSLNASINLKSNIASPAFTGNPTAPTQSAGNNSTRLATTAFVTTAVSNGLASLNIGNYAPINTPAFTGTPTAPTQAAGNNTSRLATTAFVTTAVSNGLASLNIGNYAALNSPVFTGTPTAPTAPVNDNTLKIANTSWVQREFGYASVPKWGGATKYISNVAPTSAQGVDGDIWFEY